ncbi:hypothetical protein [Spiroplasma citri]|nr:hypothetical protein [Spiroplasma citri]
MQTLKELKPDLFVQEQQSVSPTNFLICAISSFSDTMILRKEII